MSVVELRSKADPLVHHCVHFSVYVLWNLSIEGTIGTQLAVLYREVSLLQR